MLPAQGGLLHITNSVLTFSEDHQPQFDELIQKGVTHFCSMKQKQKTVQLVT